MGMVQRTVHARTVIFSAEIDAVELAVAETANRSAVEPGGNFRVRKARLSNPAGWRARAARFFLEVDRGLGLLFDVLLHALELASRSLNPSLEQSALSRIIGVHEFRVQAVHLALERIEQQFIARKRLLKRRRLLLPVRLRLGRIDWLFVAGLRRRFCGFGSSSRRSRRQLRRSGARRGRTAEVVVRVDLASSLYRFTARLFGLCHVDERLRRHTGL